MSSRINQIIKKVLLALILLNIKSYAFECILRISEDAALRPNILLTIGSRQVALLVNKDDNYVNIFENQEVEIQCKTKFQEPQYTKNKIKINCNYGRWPTDGPFVCSPQQWNLYETFENFVWCPKNTSSYLLARSDPWETKQFQYLAGVCYDTYNFSFKSLYYTVSSKHLEHLHPKTLTDFYTPSLELNYLKETFGEKSVLERNYDNEDIQNWIKFAKYNYSSILQNNLMLNELDGQLGSLLDLVWWPNLRLGNWNRYEMALKNQIEKQGNSYDILAGVSGKAKAPITQTCQTNFTLKEMTDNRNGRIPVYIWHYLRSTTNSSDEAVIIGVNSPFYEFYSESDIIFCKDKCQEIPWLNKVSSTFRYKALGVIFCCSPEDVKLSKLLDGFPEVDLNMKPEIAYTKMEKDDSLTTVNPSIEEYE